MSIKRDPMDDILDRPIAFNPAFRRISGSTVAALFLSQAWYWTKRTSDADGWFFKTIADWQEETGMTRYEQRTARKHLLEKELIEEELRGMPATLYYRVNKAKVYDLLGVQFVATPQTSLRQRSKHVSGNTANTNKKKEITTENTPEKKRPEIFQVYEQNIGVMTAIIKDKLLDIEKTYPDGWFAEAVAIAVENNVRRLSYVEAILERWLRDGKDSGRKNGNKESLRFQAIKMLSGTDYTEEDIERTIATLKGAA